MSGPSRPAAVDALRDDFNGNTPHLIRCIEALLSMDADGVLRPHGVGGHARTLLSAAAVRLAAHHGPAAVDEQAVEWLKGHAACGQSDPYSQRMASRILRALAKPAQEAAPRGGGEALICPECKCKAALYECIACSAHNYPAPPAAQASDTEAGNGR